MSASSPSPESGLPRSGTACSGVRAGAWPSWVTPELVAGRTLSFSELHVVGNWIVWLETRPDEQGRSVITARSPDGCLLDLIPEGFSVGTRVHEYGGGAWDVRLRDGAPQVVFSDRATGAVWFGNAQNVVRWTLADAQSAGDDRYADLTFDPLADAVFCVRERHGGSHGTPNAALVAIQPNGEQIVLTEGSDFYAAPRPSPDGQFLAWFSWNDPEMPWTSTNLFVAPLDRTQGGIGTPTDLTGAARCSIIEPCWSPSGTLYAASDAKGCWTPVRFSRDENATSHWNEQLLTGAEAEIGLPHWVFGQRTLAPLADGKLLALGIRNGLNHVLLEEAGQWRELCLGAPVNVPLPLSDGRFAWIDAPVDAPPAIALGKSDETIERFRISVMLPDSLRPADIARPMPLTFPTSGGAAAHALYYAPASSTSILAAEEKPPLVVMAHGGPTGRASPAFAFKVQWWTSRGFAVLDVNYRGSTGFGRAYREALDGQWGVADVEDCLAGVRFVLQQGLADPARCVIRGSSAGGLTVLGALARSRLFAAGTSLYGVTDLRALAEETHKFEARYLDGLIGPYPESEDIYLERSPLTQAESISAPVLFLHGGADKVVPLSQAESMVAMLEQAELHVYPEEAHGFRAREAVEDALERELSFYRRVFRI